MRETERQLRAATKSSTEYLEPELEPGIKKQNDNMPALSKMQIDLVVNSFVHDYTRIATLQYTHSVGQARMSWIGVDEGHHGLSHEPDTNADAQGKMTKINHWFGEQLACLAQRPAETSESGDGGSLLDNTLIVWTNELGKGNSHTFDDIPFVMVGNGLDFHRSRSLRFSSAPQNCLHLALAQGIGHDLKNFGNPDFCGEGPLILS